jgi:hypothetical protein
VTASKTGIDGVLKMDGFDEAIIGLTDGASGTGLLVYDRDKIIKILMDRDGMDEDGAIEYYDFNIAGSYVGEGTPIIVVLDTPERCLAALDEV